MKQLSAIICVGVSVIRATAADYVRDVKPLLAEHCYKCHGGQQQKSELRLDHRGPVHRRDAGATVARANVT